MTKKKMNLVLQKEYLIIEPTDIRPLIGTESVRSCCGIFIFHPSRSAVLHWDDNCCHSDLEQFVKEYLNNTTIDLKDCAVSVVGSWADHIESQKSGDFVRQFFAKTTATLDLTHFKQKKSTGSLSEQGFSLVYMDSQTGIIKTNDNWDKPILFNDGTYRGVDPTARDSCRNLQDLIHLQDDNLNESGTHIYARDSYQELSNKQSNLFCIASKNNDIAGLIKLIDNGITDVNGSPSNAKGWTPLHYACKMGHYDVALLLIQNGANLLQKNAAGSTPLNFIDPNIFEYKKLITAYRLVKYNTAINPYTLTSISLFARHHENQIDSKTCEQLNGVQKLLETPEGLSSITQMLTQ